MANVSSSKQEIKTVDQIDLRPASFEEAKNQLKEFSENSRSKYEINHVETAGGFLGLGNHKVTGEELNTALTEVQTHLIKNNADIIDVSKQIGHVYEAMESLDKEYIPAILTAVKGAELASNQAKNASEHAEHAQKDIKKTVEEQKKIIKVLENHKAKLDKLKHLENIDEIWRKSKELEQELKKFTESFERSKDRLSKLDESLKALQRFADGILDYEHLEDVDVMWSDLEDARNNITESSKQIEQLNDNSKQLRIQIGSIDSFKSQMEKNGHLFDIDEMWNLIQDAEKNIAKLENEICTEAENAQKNLNIVNNSLEEVRKQEHIFKVDEIYESTQIASEKLDKLFEKDCIQDLQLEDLKEILEQEREHTQCLSTSLHKKIKLAYVVAGCGIGMSIIQLFLLIVGVI